MAGKRKGSVRESIDELRDLRRGYPGESEQARLRMLLLMKKDPAATNTHIAELLGCAEKTVQRWWSIYHDKGIDVLLSEKKPVQPEPTRSPATTSREVSMPGHICDFLNGLPRSNDTIEWIEQFRGVFRKLYHDIDWMTINVNIGAKQDPETGSNPSSFVTQHIGAGTDVPSHLKTTIDRSSDSPGNDLVQRAKSQGFPVEKYHTPHVVDFTSANDLYLGSIILWREIRREPISSRTRRSIEKLRPFLVFMLTDCIARRWQSDPEGVVFTETVTRIVEKENLTMRQRDVLLHQLLGKTYQQTAASLSIATNTVRSHVKAIHAKTGTSSALELFARHFSPVKSRV